MFDSNKMSGAEEVRFSLKAMINKDESKLLFVEADSDFADVVLSFLTMPLGKIVRVLEKHYGDKTSAIGSLTSLYKGLQNLDSLHFWEEAGKKMLLNPRNSSDHKCRKLKLNVDDEPTNYFLCENRPCRSVFMMYSYDRCVTCGGKKYIEVPMAIHDQQSNATGVFTRNTASFIIFDDLRILHNSTALGHCFSSIGITEMEGAKIREVSFGMNEIMDLLKGSFLSMTPLSDIILKERCSSAAKPESQILFAPFVDEAVSESKKMTLKVTVQKSTNKVLFGQAEEDLVDFLFSLLAIPLGGVASLLQGNTSLTNIDNMYKDVSNSIPDKYLATPDMKNRLVKPKLGLHHLSSNQILPLDEETDPPLYLRNSVGENRYTVDSFKSPRSHANYVQGPSIYMITDDLVITQLSLVSCFSIIHNLNIPMSDVKQVDLLIGVREALRILKASLTSDSALTDALLKNMTKKEPKYIY